MNEFASEEQSQKANYAAIHARLMGGRETPKPRLSARQKMDAIIVRAEADAAKTYKPKLILLRPNFELMPQWKKIMYEVCSKHNVEVTELLSHRRDRNIVAARHEIFYRYAHETIMSYPDMGRRMNRDHSTAIHGVNKHAERLRDGRAV